MVNQISFFDVLKMLLILVAILFCTYYVTKLLAAKAAGGGGKSFFSMGNSTLGDIKAPTVIHRLMVDKDSKFVVIEYNGCDYLVAMSAGAIEVMEKRELSKEELDQRKNVQREQQKGFNFSKYLEKYKNNSQSNGGED